MVPGQKVTVDAEFTDGTADPRVLSTTTGETDGSRSTANVVIGDTIALTFKVTGADIVLVVNVTQQPEYSNLLEAQS